LRFQAVSTLPVVASSTTKPGALTPLTVLNRPPTASRLFGSSARAFTWPLKTGRKSVRSSPVPTSKAAR
jgi:hypothetical protein